MLSQAALVGFLSAIVLAAIVPVPEDCDCYAECWVDDNGDKQCDCSFTTCPGAGSCEKDPVSGGSSGQKYWCICDGSGEPDPTCECKSGFTDTSNSPDIPDCIRQHCNYTCCMLDADEFPMGWGNREYACDCRPVCTQPPE